MSDQSSRKFRGQRNPKTRPRKPASSPESAHSATREVNTKIAESESVLVRFHALSTSGDGVGRVIASAENAELEGRTVFAPLAAPEDEARLEIDEKRPRFLRGHATKFLRLSPQRVVPPCRFYLSHAENLPEESAPQPECGGCQWQHIEYSMQRRAKRDFVVQALARIGGVADTESLVADCVASPHDFAYRNKGDYVVAATNSAATIANSQAENAHFEYSKTPIPKSEIASEESANTKIVSQNEVPPNRDEEIGSAQIANSRHGNSRAQIGFFARDSHRVVDISECLIQQQPNNLALDFVRRAVENGLVAPFDIESGRGILRRVVVRTSSCGETLIVAVTTREKWPQMAQFAKFLHENLPNLVGVLRRNPQHETQLISGRDWLEESVDGLNLRVTGDGFFQVNSAATPLLLRTVLRLARVQRGERVLDLYCGVGLFALAMAREGAKVLGIEQNREAIENARLNAEINGLRAEFIAGDAAKILRNQAQFADAKNRENASVVNAEFANSKVAKAKFANVENANVANEKFANAQSANAGNVLSRDWKSVDLVVLDPPRAGAAECLAEIVQLQPRRIVYVSCDAATLARDVGVLRASGYVLREAVPLDLFPQTAHVETVALLERAL